MHECGQIVARSLLPHKGPHKGDEFKVTMRHYLEVLVESLELKEMT